MSSYLAPVASNHRSPIVKNAALIKHRAANKPYDAPNHNFLPLPERRSEKDIIPTPFSHRYPPPHVHIPFDLFPLSPTQNPPRTCLPPGLSTSLVLCLSIRQYRCLEWEKLLV
ncbi:hypothetical protein NA56DRAFT_650611 [Hyaloscypha hepaticicola]|uniref:Uncharacterized protein n=1 Tax=Hyaloscypha hepaticicola TaxID=2082293 RepID=A0A2J6PLA4_9HELO|nr:hypothetical protein NA56DRAFT_650611 [Hyaloscypha hepaticicola]